MARSSRANNPILLGLLCRGESGEDEELEKKEDPDVDEDEGIETGVDKYAMVEEEGEEEELRKDPEFSDLDRDEGVESTDSSCT